jgi:hypothetical protein
VREKQVPETQRNDDRQCADNGNISQAGEILTNRPSGAGNERQNAKVEQDVQFKKNGKSVFANQRGKNVVLFVGDRAGILPALQAIERRHGFYRPRTNWLMEASVVFEPATSG